MKHRASNIIRRLMVGTSVTTLLAAPLRAQDAVYDVPGISAWTTGKTYGFTFSPEARTGESVSRPLDGVNTRLTRSATVLLIPQTITVAQVVGGQPSVNPGERLTTFKFFGGKVLKPGWTVKSVDVGGNFTYVDQPGLGSSDLSFRMRLAPGGSATLRKVVLNGPAGATWKDAFSASVQPDVVTAPVRKDYVINGVVAWNAAKKYGFTFQPLRTGSDWGEKAGIAGATDGVFIALYATPLNRTLTWPCTPPPGDRTSSCIVGQIVGGNMSVTAPINPERMEQSVSFEMFGWKRLSPGWIVKSVSISDGMWTKQPGYGSNDLSFILRLTSHVNSSAVAIVRSITLEGPSNAASIEDAFKNANNF